MSKNGLTLFTDNEIFKAFPDPETVFASDINKHLEYFLPLASVDLSKINPEWEDTVHFIMPIEPKEGILGESTAKFHTYYSRDNWIGFRNKGGLYEFEGDWRLFVKDTLPEYYQAAHAGYELAKKHFNEHKALHMQRRKPNEHGELINFNILAS